jgi:mycofactocin precursor
MRSTFEEAGATATGREDLTTGETAENKPDGPEAKQGLVVEELLVEDVSIDGMCGVY